MSAAPGDRVVVRAWDASGVTAARCRVDGGAWVDLAPTGDGHWEGPLDGAGLAKGEHALEAVAVGVDRLEGSHRVGFMVDPTGRYTPVPEVRPVVTATAFC